MPCADHGKINECSAAVGGILSASGVVVHGYIGSFIGSLPHGELHGFGFIEVPAVLRNVTQSSLTAAALFLLPLLQVGVVAATPVSAVTVDTQPITEVLRVNGSVTSPRMAVLSTSVGALVSEFKVDIGDTAASGEPLVQLDAELARLALEGARARTLEARSALVEAQRRFTEAERLGGERGVIAATEIESRRAEVAIRQAALGVAEAAQSQQQELLARHLIRAPFAGAVSARLAEVGEWASPGDPLLELVATTGLQFDFRVPQSAFGRITADTPVRLRLSKPAEAMFAGRIEAIVPVSDAGDRTFLLRVLATDSVEYSVMPGMAVTGTLEIATGRQGVVVPRDAVLRYADGRTAVWIATEDGGEQVVRERRIDTGLEFDGVIEVLSGLEAGARVVTRGNESLREGQAVSVRATAAPTDR